MDKTIDKLYGSGFRFSKSLGQNFITDSNLLAAIVKDSEVTSSDTVVEVGAGAGTLTEHIAQKAKRVISFEIDVSLKEHLTQKLSAYPNVELIFSDILKTPAQRIRELTDGQPFRVIANIPYYITSPLIFYFLDGGFDLTSLTLMVQKEVAERIVSRGGSDYGAISANVQSRARVEILRTVGRKMFTPPPNVDSAVISIVPSCREGVDYPQLLSLIRAAFSMRRKTLLNCLGGAGINKALAEDALKEAGFEAGVRGEALTVEDFIRLSSVMIRKSLLFRSSGDKSKRESDC